MLCDSFWRSFATKVIFIYYKLISEFVSYLIREQAVNSLNLIHLLFLSFTRPVQAMYPWERPQNDKFRKAYDIDPLWNIFKPVVLKTNHRQGEDHQFADFLNRMRVGKCLETDIQMMQERVFEKNDPRIPSQKMSIFGWNSEVNEINIESLNSLEGELIVTEAIVRHKTIKNFNPLTDKKGNILNTNLQKELKFKVGSKVMLTYNIMVADGLTNGSLGVVYGVKYSSNKELQEIHVHFTGKNVAAEASKNFTHLKNKYGVSTIALKRFETEFQLRNTKLTTSSTGTAVQFPLKLADAVTAHKVIQFLKLT